MNIGRLILDYLKYSWFFLFLLSSSIFFAYTPFQNLPKLYTYLGISVVLSLLGHFAIWNLTYWIHLRLKKKSRLFLDGVSFIFSCILFLIIGAFYIGVKNWGSPINYKLAANVLVEWRSFLSILMSQIFPVIGITFCFLLLSLSYRRSKISDIQFRTPVIAFMCSVAVLLTIILSLKSDWIFKKKELHNEIFHAFVSPSKQLQRITNISLGLSNLNQKIERQDDFNKKNVVFISVDCLRADHLSMNGYQRETSPYLDSLHHNGKLKKFQLSTSTCSSSFCGILSMLNSKNLQNLTYYKYGIHDYLKNQGYRTNFILSGFHENWANIKKHYGKNIDYYIEGKDKPDFNVNDDALIVDEVKSLPNYNGQANFFFFHFMGPHALGDKAEEFEQFLPIIHKGIIRKLRFAIRGNEDLQKLYTNNYDNGVYQTDAYIKSILEIMDAKGYLKNAIVVIAGDHGESLGDTHQYLGHGKALNAEYMNVPILIIDDDIDFYAESLYASHIDIAPTIVDRLGLTIPDVWQGVSLHESIHDRMTFHEQTPQGFEKSHIAVVSKRNDELNKYILDQNSGDEILINIDKEDLTEDTLVLNDELKSFYKEKITDYLGANLDDVYTNVDSSNGGESNSGNMELPQSSFKFERCSLLTVDDVTRCFGVKEEIIKTNSFGVTRKICSSHFLWTGSGNVNQHITVDINATRTPRRHVTIVKNKMKFVPIKHKDIKQLFRSTDSNSIAFLDKFNYLNVISESEKGSIKSISEAVLFAEKIYSLNSE